MNDVNRSPVLVNLKDVHGRTITDNVEITFYNQRTQSLNQRFQVKFSGEPVQLPNVPAFPFGLAEVFIKPATYRYKSIFVNVPAGVPGQIDETFFVDPQQVTPIFPDFGEIQNGQRWNDFRRILQGSGMGITNVDVWNGLSDPQKAGLFNLYAKMQRELADTERHVIGLVDRITDFLPARVFAMVQDALHDLVQANNRAFHSVSGALHDFGVGWKLVDSYKTFDQAGNLQLTFGQNSDRVWKADIDIDDHQGIEHAADVLKHAITGKDTNPYDIHEILIYFQALDPGYELVQSTATRAASSSV